METSGKVPVLRCRKCRKCVVDASCLLTMNTVDDVAAECKIWHMDFDNLPAWILASIHQACWTSGRLSCQHCGARLGGFNFLSQPRCPCGRDLSVHLSRSRLDQDYRRSEFTSGGPPRERRVGRLPVRGGPREATPPVAEALETEPRLSNAGPVLSSPLPEGPGGLRRTAHRKSRASDYCGGGRAGTGLTGSFSDSPQTRPLAEAPPHQPRPSAAGQQEEGPETTHLQEVPTPRRRRPSLTSTDEGEEPQEGAEQTTPLRSLLLDRPVPPPRLSRRERNRLKSQRRKERRRERWVQKCLHQHTQRLMGSVASSENEDEDAGAGSAGSEGLTCAVCLDVFFSPHVCQPCGHVFCEPCLRTLAKNRPTSTPCPLCRTLITHTLFQRGESPTTPR
ncbi:E3 ubiquitin-protein ligase RNF180-like isoform X2 [Conger conger]|uniref:E3 ubiquitin-protein ligase RNF180-like isoform X2 n=1 Tax=Conger conger TaxID=82655 RepID=UPI002A5AD31F|nr:E3 ubiquitin-protein ligase RNF180-like isoform X2 [Conger conger]